MFLSYQIWQFMASLSLIFMLKTGPIHFSTQHNIFLLRVYCQTTNPAESNYFNGIFKNSYPLFQVDFFEKITTPNLHKTMPHVPQKFIRVNKSTKPAYILKIAKSNYKSRVPTIIFWCVHQIIDYFCRIFGLHCLCFLDSQ